MSSDPSLQAEGLTEETTIRTQASAASSSDPASSSNGPAPHAKAEVEDSVSPSQPHDPDPPVYEVNVKCIDGTTTKFELPSDLRGADLKELIQERLDAPPERQRLIFRGHAVKDDDLIGQHITENSQTLHMVQRPAPPPESQQSQGSGEGAEQRSQMPPQVHFQLTTADGGMHLGMPQVDLTQILGTVFGAAGRGAGMGTTMVHATGPLGPSQAQTPGDPAHAAMGPGAQAPPPPPPGGPPASMIIPPHAPPAPAMLMGEGGDAQQQMNLGSARGGMPAMGVSQGTMPAMQTSPAMDPSTGGTPAMMAGPPMQIIWQQGLGNLAHVLPTVLGDGAFQVTETIMPLLGQGQPQGNGAVEPPTPQGTPGASGGDVLPWRDLRRLTQHNARLLGRNVTRMVPPAQMPLGELNTFLSVLLSAMNQLCVAIGELQGLLNDGAGPQARHRLQFAMALVSAARTLRGMAIAMQGGNGGRRRREEAAPTAGEPSTGSLEPVVEGSVEQANEDDAAAPVAAASRPRGDSGGGEGNGGSSDSEAAGRALPSEDSSQGQDATFAEAMEEEEALAEEEDHMDNELLEVFLEPMSMPDSMHVSMPGAVVLGASPTGDAEAEPAEPRESEASFPDSGGAGAAPLADGAAGSCDASAAQ